MPETLYMTIQHRRGSAAEWEVADPVLASGEIGFETDTGLFKFGNGADLWSDLPYYSAGGGGGSGLPGADGKSILNGTSAPTDGTGDPGEFYINTTTWQIWGPKTTTWTGTGPVEMTGADGDDGIDGKTIRYGTGSPTTVGNPGDFYINTTTHELWGPRGVSNWTGTGPVSLVGPAGTDGSSVRVLGNVANFFSLPPASSVNEGEGYTLDDTGHFYVSDGVSAWIDAGLMRGPQGLPGSNGDDGIDGKTIRNGTSDPTSGIGIQGDFYINTTTSELWGPKGVSSWAGTGPVELIGAAGSNGINGKTIHNGTSDPISVGVEGDFFINTTTNEIWGPRGVSDWVGTGPTSIVGAPGSDGLDGKTVRSGTGAPIDAAGVPGDFYINTATWEIWGPKTTTWVGTGPVALIGADGTSVTIEGSVANAASLPAANSEPAGTGYITQDDGHLHVTNGVDTWNDVGVVQGPTGPTGEAGSKIYSDAQAPVNATGLSGDYWIDTTDPATMYGPKPSDADWTGAASWQIKGNTGAQGPAGNSVRNGPSDPVAQGSDGDFYINTTTNEIWGPKGSVTPGSWASTGPTGLVGDDGQPGAEGAAGKTVLNGAGVPDDVSDGVDGDFYIDTSADTIWGPKGDSTPDSWTGTGPTDLVGPTGDAGAPGSKIYSAAQAPQNATGLVGDYWLDTRDPATIYGPKLTINNWTGSAATVLKGSTGAQGPTGKSILSGTTSPTTEGSDGEFFINTTTLQFWGPKGDVTPNSWNGTGPLEMQGPQGDAGPSGRTIWSGASDPVSEGADGDFYINTTADTIWGPKGTPTPNSWVGTGPTNLKGDPGVNGKSVLHGTSSPGAGVGVTGDFYINTTTNQLWGPKGVDWVGTGPVDMIGTDGLAGSQIYKGTVAGDPPAAALGLTGDYFIDPGDGGANPMQIWGPKLNDNDWSGVTPADLTGPTGPTGDTGPAGSKIHQGASAPVDGTGVTGDYWLDTSDPVTIYGPKLVDANWSGVVSQSLKGNTGEAGPQGPAGNQVLNGTTDPDNVTDGVDGDFYINTTSDVLFGPKGESVAGEWPTPGITMQGVNGATGPSGVATISMVQVVDADWVTADGLPAGSVAGTIVFRRRSSS